jgi:hypothetical protein
MAALTPYHRRHPPGGNGNYQEARVGTVWDEKGPALQRKVERPCHLSKVRKASSDGNSNPVRVQHEPRRNGSLFDGWTIPPITAPDPDHSPGQLGGIRVRALVHRVPSIVIIALVGSLERPLAGETGEAHSFDSICRVANSKQALFRWTLYAML